MQHWQCIMQCCPCCEQQCFDLVGRAGRDVSDATALPFAIGDGKVKLAPRRIKALIADVGVIAAENVFCEGLGRKAGKVGVEETIAIAPR